MQRQASTAGDASATPDEAALYASLCLLSIPTVALKHGIELSRLCFRKPNPRALELVLFQLYAAICGEAKANKASSQWGCGSQQHCWAMGGSSSRRGAHWAQRSA